MVMAMLSQNITDNVIAPKINQSTMQVHPVLSLTALVVGSTFGGAIGMTVALPLVAVIKSLFIFYFETRTGEQIVSYEGALFRGAPFRDAQGRPVPAFDALGDDISSPTRRFCERFGARGSRRCPESELRNPGRSSSILRCLLRARAWRRTPRNLRKLTQLTTCVDRVITGFGNCSPGGDAN